MGTNLPEEVDHQQIRDEPSWGTPLSPTVGKTSQVATIRKAVDPVAGEVLPAPTNVGVAAVQFNPIALT